jgi:methyl-accepting chemotaxis protein
MFKALSTSLSTRLLVMISAVFLVLCGTLYLFMRNATETIIEEQAVALSRTVAARVEAMRSVYTKHVIGKLKADLPDDVQPDIATKLQGKGAIPLPATFVHLVGEQAAANDELANYRLLSGWNINKAKGIDDDPFLRDGWKALLAEQDALKKEANGDNAKYLKLLEEKRWDGFYRQGVNAEGKRVLRFLAVDKASSDGCVSCHNALEQDPEVRRLRAEQRQPDLKQFQLNEIMGVVAIEVPIEKAGAGAASATNQVILIFLGLAAVALALILWTVRSATGRIQLLTVATARIVKDGDLTQKIDIRGPNDEIGQLANMFQQMVTKLRDIPLTIQGSVKNLAAAAAEIYAASQEQEAAAQQQSTAVEEISRTMQSLLEAAGHISDSARGVLSNAERSRETSDLTSKKITELNNHTSRMAEILDVIREIADRSDLLALNASLEGTRAGEAGRGFSLVAAEMRRLAERVTASVADVKGLVTDVRGSGSSTVLVTEEARKLAESTTDSARQITMVTTQQRTATEQVTASMKDISSVLTQSVSAARQTRSASEGLKAQAEKLTDLLSRFRIDGDHGGKPGASA